MLLGLSSSWFRITHILASHSGVYTLTYSQLEPLVNNGALDVHQNKFIIMYLQA
jgi:hypothetical protein